MRPRLVIPLVALLVGGASCVPDPQVAGSADTCGSVPSHPAGPQEGRVAILIDGSGSTRAAAADVALPAYLDELEPKLEEAVNAGWRVSIGTFAGSNVRWTVMNQATKSVMSNPKNQERQNTATKECLRSRLGQALHTSPEGTGTDILGAVRAAGDWVRDTPASKSIVVATDGLATMGCADLTKARFGGDAELAGIVKVCLDRKEIGGQMLRGTRLSMVGVGRPGADQPVASAQQVDWLSKLWSSLCEAAGGTCTIQTSDPGRTKAGMQLPNALEDPVVGFASSWHFVVPEAALFETNRAELRAAAGDHLTGIAVAIRTTPGASVLVIGHADATENPAHNQVLSERRAVAVRDFLAANGVTNISIRGYGDTKPLCTKVPADAECLQMNRRVEIVATRK